MYELVYAKKKIRELSEQEYLTIKETRTFILFYLEFEELYEFVKANFRDFWNYTFVTCESYRLNFVTNYSELINPVLFSNQKLLNILNSYKTYIDHFSHNMSKYKDNLKISDECKKVFNNIYDSSFSYRFMTRLRNYIQHFSLPIKQINYESKLIKNEPHEWIQLISLKIKKDELLEFSGWSNVKEEIEMLDDSFDIKLYVNEYFNNLNIIHSSIRLILQEDFYESKSTFNNIILQEFNEEDRNKFLDQFNPGLFAYKIEDNEEKEKTYLPFNSLKRIDELIKRNNCHQKKGISYSITK